MFNLRRIKWSLGCAIALLCSALIPAAHAQSSAQSAASAPVAQRSHRAKAVHRRVEHRRSKAAAERARAHRKAERLRAEHRRAEHRRTPPHRVEQRRIRHHPRVVRPAHTSSRRAHDAIALNAATSLDRRAVPAHPASAVAAVAAESNATRLVASDALHSPEVGDPVALRSGSALVIDAKTGQVLLSKDPGAVRPIASLTKLMTAAVTLDAHLPMDQPITITSDDIDTLKWSSSRLLPGMTLSREELLKLALMSSENRAAHALARTYPGGTAAFVTAMNAKAHALGMLQTHYFDPTGLSPQNESSAHDLALLVKDVRNYALIREFSTHPKSAVDVGRRELEYRNTDHLIFNRGWDIVLQKTGYINEAGHCLVLNAVVQGRSVIVVLLDAWGKYSHFGDAERIRYWMQHAGRTVLSRVDAKGAVND